MNMYDIISKKRDKEELTKDEIEFFVDGYSNGKIPDYQASALLMAIFLNGMNSRETTQLTKAMTNSGTIIDLSNIEGKKIDKHSTGGVGDTVTLIIGPIVASTGVPFVKMSGRGLGHTGGTLDKLEAIDGFKIDLTTEEFEKNINDIKIAIAGQTGNIAPADGKMYALRDVTATVNNISLMASSIMSKKLAVDSDGIVLDVKVGSGAFMKSIPEAIALAEAMVQIGKESGKETIALVTNMDEPLGYAVGNILEVKEAISTLKGEGPKDLTELSLKLSAEMILLSGLVKSKEEAYNLAKAKLDNGEALIKFKEMVKKQGGNPELIDNPDLFEEASIIEKVYSKETGYIKSIDAEKIGHASFLLGAGRETIDSEIDLTAGILLNKKVGYKVEKGELLFTLYTNKKDKIDSVKEILYDSINIGNNKPKDIKDLIIKRIN